MTDLTVNYRDADPLPGEAKAWAPGESTAGQPSADTARSAVTSKLADVQREKVAASDKVYGEFESAQARLLPRIEQLSKDAGAEAQKLKPWNADEEAAKRRTDPIEAFGSFGSVFGILASAFTHAPMENALNASAAAMNAIKQGDKESYDRAEKAWLNNYKMTMDRHKIQHDAYQDAVSLLSINMTAAQTKMQMLAARFGDKQVQTLLEAGMSKEVEELLGARQRNALALQEAMPRIVEDNARISRLFALGYDPKNPTTEKSQQAYQTFKKEQTEAKQAERAYTPEQQAYTQFIKDNPGATAEQRAEYVKNLRSRDKQLTPEQEATTAFIEQNPTATAEQIRDFVTELRSKSRGAGGAGNQNLTIERQVAAEAARLKKEYVEQGMPEGEAVKKSMEEASKLRRVAAAPSGNKIDELTGKINRVEYAESTIDKVEELLKKHKAITGLGGTVSRPMEVVGNIFGSNETDRRQFERYVLELQEWAPRILTDSNGRPLSAEASKVSGIIAGLRLGDTTANTARAYAELRPLLKRIKEDLGKRRSGEPASADQPRLEKKPSWMDAPEVK